MGQTQNRHGRTRRALMWQRLPPPPKSQAAPPQPIHHRYKTPYSNLTAEVEWWHGSSRVPCRIHRILMAVRQRPQALGQLYKPGPIVLTITPRWHAITQTLFTFDVCLAFFLGLFFASPPYPCSPPTAGSSSCPLFNPVFEPR